MSNDGRTRKRRALAASVELREGERLMPFFCWDLAGCACAPSTSYHDIPCVSVGITPSRQGVRIARCLACDVSWQVPAQRRIDRMPSGGVR